MLFSLTGSMMQNAALLWHVSLLVSPERKALALGSVGLVRFVPIVVFSMISGVVADVWNRRRDHLARAGGARVSRVICRVAALRADGDRCVDQHLRPARSTSARADAR